MKNKIIKLIGKNWRQELNKLLALNYTAKDCADIFSSDNIITKSCAEDFKLLGNKFYQQSKNYVFLNCAKDIISMGFHYLPLVYTYGRNKRFLDYGAGSGNSLIVANGGTYVDVEGIASQTAQARLKSRNIKAKFIYAKVNKFATIRKNYDCICCCETLEHIFHAEKLLALLCARVRPEGFLILSHSFTSPEDPTHLPQYNMATKLGIQHILAKNNFSLWDKDNYKGHFKVYKKLYYKEDENGR